MQLNMGDFSPKKQIGSVPDITPDRSIFYHPVRPLVKFKGYVIFNEPLVGGGLLRFIDRKHANTFFSYLKQRCKEKGFLKLYNDLVKNRYNKIRDDNLWVNLNNLEPDHYDEKIRRFKKIILGIYKHTKPKNAVVFPYFKKKSIKEWPPHEIERFVTFCVTKMNRKERENFIAAVLKEKLDLSAWNKFTVGLAEWNFVNPGKLSGEIVKNVIVGPKTNNTTAMGNWLRQYLDRIAKGKLIVVTLPLDGGRIGIIPNTTASKLYTKQLAARYKLYSWADTTFNPDNIANINIIEKGFSKIDLAVIPSLSKINHKEGRLALLGIYGLFMFMRNLPNPLSWYTFLASLTRINVDVKEMVAVWNYGTDEERALLTGQIAGMIYGSVRGPAITKEFFKKFKVVVSKGKTIIKPRPKTDVSPARIKAGEKLRAARSKLQPEKTLDYKGRFSQKKTITAQDILKEANISPENSAKTKIAGDYANIRNYITKHLLPNDQLVKVFDDIIILAVQEEKNMPNGVHLVEAVKSAQEACAACGIKDVRAQLKIMIAAALHDPPNKVGFGPEFIKHNITAANRVDVLFNLYRDKYKKLPSEINNLYKLCKKTSLAHQEAPCGFMAFVVVKEIIVNILQANNTQAAAIGNLLWNIKINGKIPKNFWTGLRNIGISKRKIARLKTYRNEIWSIKNKLYYPEHTKHLPSGSEYIPCKVYFTPREQGLLNTIYKGFEWYVQDKGDILARETAIIVFLDGKANYTEPAGLRKILIFCDDIRKGYNELQGLAESSFTQWIKNLDRSIPGVTELIKIAKITRKETEIAFNKSLTIVESRYTNGYSPAKPAPGSFAEKGILSAYNSHAAKKNLAKFNAITEENWAQIKNGYKEAFLDDLMVEMDKYLKPARQKVKR
ncbi:MAG: hypothetical protein ABIH00_11250 [Armatimonadota bacterium]